MVRTLHSIGLISLRADQTFNYIAHVTVFSITVNAHVTVFDVTVNVQCRRPHAAGTLDTATFKGQTVSVYHVAKEDISLSRRDLVELVQVSSHHQQRRSY